MTFYPGVQTWRRVEWSEYTLNAESLRLLVASSSRMSDWLEPDLPGDLSLLRGPDPWLASVTACRVWQLVVDPDELEALRLAAPRLHLSASAPVDPLLTDWEERQAKEDAAIRDKEDRLWALLTAVPDLRGFDRENVAEFIRVGEWGLAFDTLIVQAFEYDVPLSDEAVRLARGLEKDLEMNLDELDLLADGRQ